LSPVKDTYISLLMQLQSVLQLGVEEIRLSILKLMNSQFEKYDSLMDQVSKKVVDSLGSDAELAVRSSSSMEDLPG
jgi:hypothetical protein